MSDLEGQAPEGEPPTFVRTTARIAYETIRLFSEAQGESSQKPWADVEESVRLNAMADVRRVIYNPDFGPRDNHTAWVREKKAEGWIAGPEHDSRGREHPLMVPWEQLPVLHQRKEQLFVSIVRGLTGPIDDAEPEGEQGRSTFERVADAQREENRRFRQRVEEAQLRRREVQATWLRDELRAKLGMLAGRVVDPSTPEGRKVVEETHELAKALERAEAGVEDTRSASGQAAGHEALKIARGLVDHIERLDQVVTGRLEWAGEEVLGLDRRLQALDGRLGDMDGHLNEKIEDVLNQLTAGIGEVTRHAVDRAVDHKLNEADTLQRLEGLERAVEDLQDDALDEHDPVDGQALTDLEEEAIDRMRTGEWKDELLDELERRMRKRIDELEGMRRAVTDRAWDHLEVENMFTHHPPNDDDVQHYRALRSRVRELAHYFVDVLPVSAEKSRAIAYLDAAMMHANAARARHDGPHRVTMGARRPENITPETLMEDDPSQEE